MAEQIKIVQSYFGYYNYFINDYIEHFCINFIYTVH